ncbi:hypothetical protein V6N12_052729 [Hibiscus sabdariffa]|uniref:Clp R domain-containing protein n=1 Tax=Hibiscus sabdariffa TaxID=183260 RepID=A0ABR2C2K7_9ROSI
MIARVVAQSALLTAPTHTHGHAPSKEIGKPKTSVKMAGGLETPLLRIRSDSVSLGDKLVRFGHDFCSPVTLSSRPVTGSGCVAKEARFEGFTGKAFEALMIARDESERLCHECIELEHILLGLISGGTGIAAESLKSIGIKPEDVREYAIESPIGAFMGSVSVLWLLFSPTAMDTLILSFEEARKLGHNYIGPEHLLLGLLRRDNAREDELGVFEFLDFDSSNIRTEVLRMVGEGDTVSVVPEGSTSNAKVATLGANLMQCIGATTLDDYNEHSVEGTIAILMGLKEHFEIHHNLCYEDHAVITVAELSNQFIRELHNREMELRMQFHIFHEMSQDEAVKTVSFCAYNGLRRFCISQPIASFIFYGPTGVGKSELAKALAANYFGSEEAVTQFDMTEFMGSHTLSKLIGSSFEGGQLTDAVRRQPHTVVLFKEIEKAHLDILNMIRQILSDGFLADGKGRIVDFRNTLLIMTSNAGSSVIEKDERPMEFDLDEESRYNRMKSLVMEELKQRLGPNLIDKSVRVIVFRHLNKSEVKEIADIKLKGVFDRFKAKEIQLHVTESFRERVVEQGYDSSCGARPLKRAIRHLEDSIAEKMVTRKIKEGDSVTVDVNSDGNVVILNG